MRLCAVAWLLRIGGTCHDHQFVQTTANRIMEILPNGALIDKMTTYDEYLASDEMARKRHVYTMTEEDN